MGHLFHEQALNPAHGLCLGLGPGTAAVWKRLSVWRQMKE